MEVLLLGEAPARGGDGRAPLDGPSGRRMERLLGIGEGELPRVADAANLLPSWPGRARSGSGSAFPIREAREAARRGASPHPRILILGRRAAAALGFGPRIPLLEWFRDRGREWAVVPHPSGASRWWNDPARSDRAARFLREALNPAAARLLGDGPEAPE